MKHKYSFCQTQTAEVLSEHLMLLRRAYVGWDDCEFGAPAIDCKRPYGNSSVERDVAEILGWPCDRDDDVPDVLKQRATALHKGTEAALQIALTAGSFGPDILGSYVKCVCTSYHWVKNDEGVPHA